MADDKDIAAVIDSYLQVAKKAKVDRTDKTRDNFDAYHLKQDFDHKNEGQSQEYLSKQPNAVEQLTAFLKKGLLDQKDDWFSIENEGKDAPPEDAITPMEQFKLLRRQQEKAKFEIVVEDALKSGLLGSLMVTKVLTRKEKVVVDIEVKELEDGSEVPVNILKEFTFLDYKNVRAEDWFPDPTGDNNHCIERIEMDWHVLRKLDKDNPGVFNSQVIADLMTGEEELQKHRKSRETDQNTTDSSNRRRVVLYEFWGNIINKTSGEIEHENCQAIITSDMQVVMSPRDNPNWHQKAPYVSSPIIRVPNSVWHKAIMDNVTVLGSAVNELFNLMLDNALMATHGIKQIREDWLEDPSEVEEGIYPGMTLSVNSLCPPNAKVLERVDTSTANSAEAHNMFNMVNNELNQAAITNELAMGNLPERQVKATEIVASSNSNSAMMNSLASTIEQDYLKALLEMSWLTQAQHQNDMSDSSVQVLLGKERAELIETKSHAQIFRETALGKKFKVFGLSNMINKVEDFRKLTALAQTIGGSELMLNEFMRTHSMGAFLTEIMKSLNIDPDKLKISPEEKAEAEQRRALEMQAKAAQGQTGDNENLQSQIPQASTGSEKTETEVPRADLERGPGYNS
jgi:hypothetical protein